MSAMQCSQDDGEGCTSSRWSGSNLAVIADDEAVKKRLEDFPESVQGSLDWPESQEDAPSITDILAPPQHCVENQPPKDNRLRLLSLGGIEGVSGSYMLQYLKLVMDGVNSLRHTRHLPRAAPCEVFDLIGGTGTGGVIAVLLGRLKLDVDECIVAYESLVESGYQKKSTEATTLIGHQNFEELRAAVENALSINGSSAIEAFNDGEGRLCRTFVCATEQDTANTIRLKTYSVLDEDQPPATICEAALATSAIMSSSDPVSIGTWRFVTDRQSVINIDKELESEATHIWASSTGDVKPLVASFVSIGTMHPGRGLAVGNLNQYLLDTQKNTKMESIRTDPRFLDEWNPQHDEKRYYRFNVDDYLQYVRFLEYDINGSSAMVDEEFACIFKL